MLHSDPMEGHKLLQLLMDKRGLNPNALADALRSRTLQSQVQRYLAGTTKNPRPDTLKPIAKFFDIGVEAFYQPTIAQEVALRLNLVPTPAPTPAQESNTMRESRAIYDTSSPVAPPTPLRTAPNLRDVVIQLGRFLEPHDESARKAVAILLHDLAIHPDDAYLAANRIAALLDAPGNGAVARSTISQ